MVLIRSSMKECRTALQPFCEEEESAVAVAARANNTFDLVLKENTYDFNAKRKKPKKVGFCCSITTLSTYQGASYDKVKYIIWDECIDDGAATTRTTLTSMKMFERFISSVVRNKLDVKVLIFGNLLEKISGMAGDPVLDHYGISVNCGCKYIPARNSSEATILYLNTKEMFKGIEVQGVIGGVQSLTSKALLSNQLLPRGIKLISHANHLDCTPYRCLVFTYDKKVISIHINITPYKEIQSYYTILVEPFNMKTVYSNAYTNEAPLYNNYSHVLIYVEDEVWADILEDLYDFCSVGRVLYVGEESAIDLNVYMKHFVPMIIQNKNKNV